MVESAELLDTVVISWLLATKLEQCISYHNKTSQVHRLDCKGILEFRGRDPCTCRKEPGDLIDAIEPP